MRRLPTSLVISLLILSWSTTASAQKIYVLLTADTSEKSGLSFSTGPDLQYMFDAFYCNVPEDQCIVYGYSQNTEEFEIDLNLASHKPWPGPSVRGDLFDYKNKILEAIDNCPANSNDTMVVFYSGHGAYDDEHGHFLIMPDGQTRLYRKTILKRMANKKPRLSVLLTDSCNLHVPAGMYSGPSPMLASPGVITPLFESLFIRSHGVTDINSSTEGEESIGAIGGGLLTLAMAYMGNQPDFKSYPRFVKPEPVEEERDSSNPFSAYNDEPKPRIPSMDHHAAMKEFFGVEIEHGMHGNFDPELPAYGVFFANDYDDLNWQQVSRLLTKKVNALFHVALPKGWDASDGKKQMAQTPRFYSLGKRKGPPIRRKRPVFEPF